MADSFERKLDRLRKAVADRRVTQTDVSTSTGVNQSQVSRILAGPVKRYSENVQKLCVFADSLVEPPNQELDGEASLLLAQIMEGNPMIKAAAIDLLRNILVLRREYENARVK